MSFQFNTDEAAELAYDAVRCVFKKKEISKDGIMKDFDKLEEQEKRAWRAVSNTLSSFVISTIEANNAKHEVKRTLQAIADEEKKEAEKKQ